MQLQFSTLSFRFKYTKGKTRNYLSVQFWNTKQQQNKLAQNIDLATTPGHFLFRFRT